MPRWTAEARAKQAQTARRRQPWKHSTGPKTHGGKSRSRWNAYKHGLDSAKAIELRRLLAQQNRIVRTIFSRRKMVNAGKISGSRIFGQSSRSFAKVNAMARKQTALDSVLQTLQTVWANMVTPVSAQYERPTPLLNGSFNNFTHYAREIITSPGAAREALDKIHAALERNHRKQDELSDHFRWIGKFDDDYRELSGELTKTKADLERRKEHISNMFDLSPNTAATVDTARHHRP